MKRISWLVLLGLALALPVHAASFNCAKARTKVEHLICGNAELSKLDDELAAKYKSALKDKTNATAIRHAQRVWIKKRNQCSSFRCIQAEYQDRIASLDKKVPDAETSSSTQSLTKQKKKLVFRLEKDTGWTVCHDMVKNLNKVQPSLASFATELVFDPKMTQFSWPDWKELDIKDYLDVVYAIENKLMHINPSEAQSFDEWKKTYLADMKIGASGKVSRLGQKHMVWRPRLRIARVRFEADGPLETVLGYSRNRDAGEWQKGWYAECPPNYSNPEAARQTRECSNHYKERLGIESLEGWPGDYIVLYDPKKRKVDFILPGDRNSLATASLPFFLILHNGIDYMSYANITGMDMIRMERVKSLRPTVPSWVQGRKICGLLYPRPRNQ